MKQYRCSLLFGLFAVFSLQAQTDTTDFKGVAAVVFMDSFIVTAKRVGFDTDEFIQYVIEDESFYHAFQNIRFESYVADNAIVFLDRKGKTKASYESVTAQIFDGECRRMSVLSESSSGKFYKRKKKYRYYTATMFDKIFFTNGKACGQQVVSNSHIPVRSNQKGKTEKYIYELKKLIFRPGEKVNIPLIGNKTAIFSPKMMPFYNYFLRSQKLDGVDCYVFIASAKPEFAKNETVIKYMESYFEKENFQIIARNYKLEYDAAVFSFDIKMKVKLDKKGDVYLPLFVEYDGVWDVPMKTAERCVFSMKVREW